MVKGAASSSSSSSAATTSTPTGGAAPRQQLPTMQTGQLPSDPSLRLVAPRRHSRLPGVLRQREATELLDTAAVAADDEDDVELVID